MARNVQLKRHPHYDEKTTMKTMTQTIKALLEAMAFANVSNLGEFRAMLRQVDRPAEPSLESDDVVPPASHIAVLSHAQGAL